ncbi:PAS domain-containing protein [Candidatus Saccharibacteria bacterium]|nr:PAS domain-containing protein [Candidatus Saccharibacteria bacterium]
MQNSQKWLLNESMAQLDHNRLLALINSLEEGFLAVDEEGQIELCNGIALALLDDHKLNGKMLTQAMRLVDQADQPVDVLALVKTANGRLSSADYRLVHNDGMSVKLNIRVSPVRGFDTRASGGYVVLISEI